MGQEEDVQMRQERERVYRQGLALGDTLVETVRETVERGIDRLLAQRADEDAAASSLVAAIRETDKAIYKSDLDDDGLRIDLRAQRQQLVDALCGLSGAKTKEG